MSEYQYFAFRAIDAPVSPENLAYMRRQSMRAEITPWRFDNQYQWGDFHGDALEMLRRGYDFHMHYADFGIRALYFRLPTGFPDPKASKFYLAKDALHFVNDKSGPGGALAVEPYIEAGDYDDPFEFDELIDQLLPLRAEILAGDLRPLYLAHLAVARDDNHDPDDATEGPVPAGLDQLTIAQLALAKFYGIPKSWLNAAAAESPPLPEVRDQSSLFAEWLAGQPQKSKDRWLADLLCENPTAVRAEVRAEFSHQYPAPPWPVVRPDRAMSQLQDAADRIEREAEAKASEIANRKQKKKFADIAADPQAYLLKVSQIVDRGTTAAFDEAARLLAEIREALSETRYAGLADSHAQKIHMDHPTRRRLVTALRRENFLPKK